AAPLIGNDEISVDSLLYSSPIAQNFRVFTHNGWKMASFKEGNNFALKPIKATQEELKNFLDQPIDDVRSQTYDYLTDTNNYEYSSIEGKGYLRHYGLGLEYAQDSVTATGEVHYDNAKFETVGVDLGVDYQIDDYWQIFTRLSSLDNNISVRALAHDVTAKSAQFGFTYRANESRQFNVSTRYYNFSSGHSHVYDTLTPNLKIQTPEGNIDLSVNNQGVVKATYPEGVSELLVPELAGIDLSRKVDISSKSNNRYAIDTTYYERWINTPIYKLGTYLNAGLSANTSQNVFYYSPKKDASVSLTLDNDLLTYRHYETAFHQRLAVSVGNYWQETYGSNIVGNVQYEHRWQVANRFELSYGGVRGYHYYDDGLTKNWFMYLTADLRF
ncbi:MAG: hypothetical protein CTY13_04580, partial [Methylobacter sp.]